MKILIYSLMVLSSGLALLVVGLIFMLGWIFQSSASSSDAVWGFGLIAFGILYGSHPYLIYWLFGKGFLISAVLVALFFIVCSIGMVFILPTAIEAGSRP